MAELESDPDVMKFTPSRVPWSREQTEHRLKALIEKESVHAPLGVWAIELKDSGDFAGWICLLNTKHEFPELGFMIVRRHWGKGFATEAAARLIDFGFKEQNLAALVATTDQDNTSSKKVLSKLGFVFSKNISVDDKALQKTITLDVLLLQFTA